MSYSCETVKVVTEITAANPHGYVVINKSDLTDEHQIFEALPVTDQTVLVPAQVVAEVVEQVIVDATDVGDLAQLVDGGISDNDPATTAAPKPWEQG